MTRGVAINAKWPEIERLAKTRAPEAIQTLSEIMLDPDESGSTRVQAANAILDRGYGKPKSRVDVSGSIDVNAAHLHAIKIMADQVKAETRLIDKEGKPKHEITIVPVETQKPSPGAQDIQQRHHTTAVQSAHRKASPDIFQ